MQLCNKRSVTRSYDRVSEARESFLRMAARVAARVPSRCARGATVSQLHHHCLKQRNAADFKRRQLLSYALRTVDITLECCGFHKWNDPYRSIQTIAWLKHLNCCAQYSKDIATVITCNILVMHIYNLTICFIKLIRSS